MATITTINLIDDYTGELGAETIKFTVNGEKREIEMTPETFNEVFGKLMELSRPEPKKSYDAHQGKTIRAWLVENNIPHSKSGRLSYAQKEMFNKAHGIK